MVPSESLKDLANKARCASETSFQKHFFAKHYDSIAPLIDVIHIEQEFSEDSLSKFFCCLEPLANASFLRNTHQGRKIVEKAAHLVKLSNKTNEPLSPTQQDELKQVCNEIRIRLLAAAMGVQSLKTMTGETGSLDDHACAPALPILSSRGRVVSALIKTSMVILLPHISSSAHGCEVIAGLLEVLDRTPRGYNWIVDFSAVQRITPMVLGSVIAYERTINKLNGNFYICWLRQDLMLSPAMERLTQVLDLKTIGDYLFSRSI